MAGPSQRRSQLLLRPLVRGHDLSGSLPCRCNGLDGGGCGDTCKCATKQACTAKNYWCWWGGKCNKISSLSHLTDRNNCGSCGNCCTGSTTCCGGKCQPPASFQRDPRNCGKCGTKCGSYQTCCKGICIEQLKSHVSIG